MDVLVAVAPTSAPPDPVALAEASVPSFGSTVCAVILTDPAVTWLLPPRPAFRFGVWLIVATDAPTANAPALMPKVLAWLLRVEAACKVSAPVSAIVPQVPTVAFTVGVRFSVAAFTPAAYAPKEPASVSPLATWLPFAVTVRFAAETLTLLPR